MVKSLAVRNLPTEVEPIIQEILGRSSENYKRPIQVLVYGQSEAGSIKFRIFFKNSFFR